MYKVGLSVLICNGNCILYRGTVSNRGNILLLDFSLEDGMQINCCGFIKRFEARFH